VAHRPLAAPWVMGFVIPADPDSSEFVIPRMEPYAEFQRVEVVSDGADVECEVDARTAEEEWPGITFRGTTPFEVALPPRDDLRLMARTPGGKSSRVDWVRGKPIRVPSVRADSR